MSASDRTRWVAAGSPFRLMTPAAALRDVLRKHGYTVYDIGNRSHLEHEPPEDHTPYSETGYPGKAKYGVGYAIDIMPPASGAESKIDGKPLPTLQQLGARLLADRKANVSGIRWLKYMNWEPERNNGGPCYQDSWKPNYARRSSSDRGHIHMSGLTGYETSTIGAGYDPVTRIRGGDDMTAEASNAIIELRNALLDPKKNGGYGASVLQMLKDGAYVLVKGPASSGAWIGKEVAALTATVRELAAAAGVAPQQLAEIQERVDQVADDARQYAEAEAARDAALSDLVRAGQSGELTAEQVLVKLRDLLPASTPTQG